MKCQTVRCRRLEERKTENDTTGFSRRGEGAATSGGWTATSFSILESSLPLSGRGEVGTGAGRAEVNLE